MSLSNPVAVLTLTDSYVSGNNGNGAAAYDPASKTGIVIMRKTITPVFTGKIIQSRVLAFVNNTVTASFLNPAALLLVLFLFIV